MTPTVIHHHTPTWHLLDYRSHIASLHRRSWLQPGPAWQVLRDALRDESERLEGVV